MVQWERTPRYGGSIARRDSASYVEETEKEHCCSIGLPKTPSKVLKIEELEETKCGYVSQLIYAKQR